MDNEQSLQRLANRYRSQGYTVTVSPGLDVLPPFARAFQVELLARRPDGNVLVSAKPTVDDIERNMSLVELADLVDQHHGWRYDITLLQPVPSPPRPAPRHLVDLTVEQIETMFSSAEKLFEGGFEPQAVIAAWAAAESSMRHRLRAIGRKPGSGSSSKSLISELLSSGEIDHGEHRDLETLSDLRNVIVHGFEPPNIEHATIELLGFVARRLLADSAAKLVAS